MTTTSVVDLDPIFVKALRLLHSKSKESTLQLKALYEEALRQRKGGNGGGGSVTPGGSPANHKKLSSDVSRRESEKRNIDKLKRDLSELVPNKRARLGSPGFSSKSHTPSPTPPGSLGDPSGGNSSCDDLGISGGNGSDLEMNLDTLTCCICKSFNQENGNKLMECHTCQNLFHQECHIPIISNEDANDPGLVWHCTNCSKTLKRVSPPMKTPANPGTSPSLTTKTGSPKVGTTLPGNGSRPSPSKPDPVASSNTLFKRVTESTKGVHGISSGLKSSSSNNKTPSSANRSSRTPSSSSSSSKSSSTKVPTSTSVNPPSTILTVDKRLQMMKKKAAARKK